MILNPKETTVAYRCPHCGATIMSLVGVFSLSGDLIKLKCNCENSEMQISYTTDGKIRLTIPCLLCPKPHTYVISAPSFFERDILSLTCPYTGIGVCFIGKKNAVMDAAKEADEELMDMLEEAGLDDPDSFSKRGEQPDEDDCDEGEYNFYDVVQYLIAELQEEGTITCSCPEGTAGDYDYELLETDDGRFVRIFCTRCGASALIPMAGFGSAPDLLQITHLDLK